MQAWREALDLTNKWDKARTADEVARGLLTALDPWGAKGLFAGSFPILPFGRLDQIVAGTDILAQRSPPGWQAAYARRGLDRGNPVILAAGRTNAPFRWSEGGVPKLKGWRGLLLARELGIEDGIAIPCPELGGRAGILSIAFERVQFGPEQRQAIQFTAIAAYERMRTLRLGAPQAQADLTPRERDCLAFVADGKSDAEIAEALRISTTTVHWHIENAKRKLAAKTRAQAIAKAYTLLSS